jgi:SAM-dependent methyltransferase
MTDHTETAPGGKVPFLFPHGDNPNTSTELQRVEEISRIPAKIMLLQSGLLSPASADAVVLDNACGLGVVAGVLFDEVGNNGVKVVCGDVKPKMVEWAAERFLANKWNAEAKIIDAQVWFITPH